MPQGKPAGVPCAHLRADFSCELFGLSSRPKVCSDFKADLEHCGADREEALLILSKLERDTAG
jgi:hypothetical protein